MRDIGVRKGVLIGFLGVAWLLCVLWGMNAQMERERIPGSEGEPTVRWPEASFLTGPSTLPVLVLALHPKCPCSRATLEELAVLHRDLAGRLRSQLLFLQPEGCSEEWVRSDLWTLALSIPGAIPVADPGGREAARFGARTSGHAFLYGRSGLLLFSGGLTRARGTTGPSAGLASITSLVNGRGPSCARTPVYGCGLRNPEAP